MSRVDETDAQLDDVVQFAEEIGVGIAEGITLSWSNHLFARKFMIDGEIAAILGILMVRPRVGEVWAMFSDAGREKPFGIIRRMRTLLNATMESGCVGRLQTIVEANDDGLREWAESFGGKHEARLHNFGAEAVGDVDIYAWTDDMGASP